MFETLIAALARLRVALGWVFGVLVIVLAQPTGASIAIGMSIAAAGEAVRVWAAGHLNKSREVTSSGPYRWVGHPLYLGSTVMGIGLAIACRRLNRRRDAPGLRRFAASPLRYRSYCWPNARRRYASSLLIAAVSVVAR